MFGTRTVRSFFKGLFTAQPSNGGPRYVGLRHQRPLNSKELALARNVITWIKGIRADRAQILAETGANKEFISAQGVWTSVSSEQKGPVGGANTKRLSPRAARELGLAAPEISGLNEGFNRVCQADRDVLNSLRLFTQHFTGYRLVDMDFAEGRPFPSVVPPGLDEKIAAIDAKPAGFLDRYAAMASAMPSDLCISPPNRFGEIGWNVDDVIVSWDTIVYMERMALLYEHGVIDRLREIATDRPVRILEIGGGYGGLGYYLRKAIPNSRYVIVDLPESLVFSGIYGSITDPGQKHVYCDSRSTNEAYAASTPGYTFVSNFHFDRLVETNAPFDLAINTLSMSEMSKQQVEHYCQGISKLIGESGQFFEQNQDNRHLGVLDARQIIQPFFKNQKVLTSTIVPGLTQGCAHLWSNDEPLPN